VSISFVHDGPGEKMQGFPVETITPADGTGAEIGSMSIIKGARNLEAAKKFYEWALTPGAQEMAAAAKQFQLPSNKAAKVDARVPDFKKIKFIDYDYAKYGASAERRRLIAALGKGSELAAAVSGELARSASEKRPGSHCRRRPAAAPAERAAVGLDARRPARLCAVPWYALQDGQGLMALHRVCKPAKTGNGSCRRCCWGAPGCWRARRSGACAAARAMPPGGASRVLLLAGGIGGAIALLATGLRSAPRAGASPGWSKRLRRVRRAAVGMGWGAAIALVALTVLGAFGIGARGRSAATCSSPPRSCSAAACSRVHRLPRVQALAGAFVGEDGHAASPASRSGIASERNFGLQCLAGGVRCGVRVEHAVSWARRRSQHHLAGHQLLALMAERAGSRYGKPLNVLALLPIITPPFVVGLGLILLFGRAGIVNQLLESTLGLARRAGSTEASACGSRRPSRSRRSPS
jgi:hypothetical protein